ncbi:MAG: hypothetical protein JRD05_00705 [Deltaproteobacteria bacterium]|nr:hypothetical protein [Deltaproteobacteria bacterium]
MGYSREFLKVVIWVLSGILMVVVAATYSRTISDFFEMVIKNYSRGLS